MCAQAGQFGERARFYVHGGNSSLWLTEDALWISIVERSPVDDRLPITMLVSTHDMALVNELFPRTVVMDEGQVVADGLTMEILDDEVLLNAHVLEKP